MIGERPDGGPGGASGLTDCRSRLLQAEADLAFAIGQRRVVADHRDRLIETVRKLRAELEAERNRHRSAAEAILHLAAQNARLIARPAGVRDGWDYRDARIGD